MGPEDIPLLLIVGGPILGGSVWGIIDAARLPRHAWRRAGQNKVLWIILQVFGLPVTVAYAMAIRPKVKQALDQPYDTFAESTPSIDLCAREQQARHDQL